MTDIETTPTIVPCQDIEPVHMANERQTLARRPRQTAFAAFNDWAHLQARHLCDRGSCVTGTCRGHVEVKDWRMVEDHGETFTCEFTAGFFCRCE